jgi:hypothetical protein
MTCLYSGLEAFGRTHKSGKNTQMGAWAVIVFFEIFSRIPPTEATIPCEYAPFQRVALFLVLFSVGGD